MILSFLRRMSLFTVTLGICLLYTREVGSSNLFTGTDGLKKLSRAEHLVVDDLQKVSDNLQSKLNLLKM